MINFVLCDDDLDTLNNLSHIFESIFMQHNLEATVSFATASDAKLLSYINDNPVDVLILDIELHSNYTGLEIAQKVRAKNKDCYIIFVTGYFEHIMQSLEYNIFDYIYKPINKERLEKTVLRLFDYINGSTSNKTYIKLDSKNTIIEQSEIQYIKREGMKIIFHTPSRDYEVYSSFSKIQNKLPKNFIRCHKSFIANINNITKLESTSNQIYFSDKHQCDIGPKYKENFMKEVKIYGNIT